MQSRRIEVRSVESLLGEIFFLRWIIFSRFVMEAIIWYIYRILSWNQYDLSPIAIWRSFFIVIPYKLFLLRFAAKVFVLYSVEAILQELKKADW